MKRLIKIYLSVFAVASFILTVVLGIILIFISFSISPVSDIDELNVLVDGLRVYEKEEQLIGKEMQRIGGYLKNKDIYININLKRKIDIPPEYIEHLKKLKKRASHKKAGNVKSFCS